MTIESLSKEINEFINQSEFDLINKYCVGVAPVKDECVALVRRVPEDYLGGYWELAGGGMDDGETLYKTIIRETQEELNVEIKRFGKILPTFDYSSNGLKVRQFNIVVDIEDQEIKLNPKEHDALVWVNLKNLENDLEEKSIKLTSEILNVINAIHS